MVALMLSSKTPLRPYGEGPLTRKGGKKSGHEAVHKQPGTGQVTYFNGIPNNGLVSKDSAKLDSNNEKKFVEIIAAVDVDMTQVLQCQWGRTRPSSCYV
ncbi:Hypothetical predicted protein [Octopus vulgaris]|uniref:Uncharacterized protein n=1 Tax=Octopus vulgaris TaxID=6645 RepID=A0AA36BW75_OCTVU|nr:Hypothetical predicted protein [Octopus vulgaris]